MGVVFLARKSMWTLPRSTVALPPAFGFTYSLLNFVFFDAKRFYYENRGQSPGEGKHFLPSRHRVSELHTMQCKKKAKSLICRWFALLCVKSELRWNISSVALKIFTAVLSDQPCGRVQREGGWRGERKDMACMAGNLGI